MIGPKGVLGSRQLLILHKMKRKEYKPYKNGVCSPKELRTEGSLRNEPL